MRTRTNLARWSVIVAPAIAVLTACSDTTSPPSPRATPNPTSALVATDGSIPGNYIVVADWNADVLALTSQYGIRPKYVYEQLINGFAAAFPTDVANALAADPRVLKITVQRQFSKNATVTQAHATWGIDRIDQRALPMDSSYSYDFTGAGVSAYIIDTGIRYSHSEFEGRAVRGFDAFAADPADPLLGYDGSGDCDGHGTHVSGTVGGKTWGVAKKVRLVGVRVLNCAGYGSDADVIAGMDWVAKNATLPASANMSLGDVVPTKTMGTNGPVDDAVKPLIAACRRRSLTDSSTGARRHTPAGARHHREPGDAEHHSAGYAQRQPHYEQPPTLQPGGGAGGACRKAAQESQAVHSQAPA